MEKHVSSLDGTSNVLLSAIGQECKPLVTSQTNNDNQKDGECVLCHVCAIEVPRRFIHEHYKSDKHRINTKIADVALKRVKNLLHYNIVSDVDETESLYFCPQCVIAMNPRDRQSHEKSVVHKKALTVDKFLYDFYFLYANEDEDSGIAKECEATMAVQSNDVEPVNNIDNASLNIDKILFPKFINIPENIEAKTDNSVGNTNKNVLNSNENKVETKPNTSNTSQIDKSLFCTFGTNKNQIFCKVCKVYVPNITNNLLSHQRGFKHKEVLRKLKNMS